MRSQLIDFSLFWRFLISAGVFASAFGAVVSTAHATESAGPPPLRWRVLTPELRLETEANASSSLKSSMAPRTPLGSLWKLFVYAYLTETGASESPYTCRGVNPEELFCCAVGQSIERDLALAKSCALYLEPSRLGIEKVAWRKFWQSTWAENIPGSMPSDIPGDMPSVPSWLTNLDQLKPETQVSADEILFALLRIRQKLQTFRRIEAATLGTVLRGTAAHSLKNWGSTLRVKTYTWRDAETTEQIDALGFTGGFAGWLPDGSAIWVSQAGHGRDAFQEQLKAIVDRHLQPQDSTCVRVAYFDRYPIDTIKPNGARLSGPTEIRFRNGNTLKFIADGSLSVRSAEGGARVSAELSLNEYVARVLDREVQTTPVNAARAFAITVRTYLRQNAVLRDGCFEIADSSHRQRVSPQAASASALNIARWSDGLELDQVARIRYHENLRGSNQMSWRHAKGLAQAGYSMIEILQDAYPTGRIVFGPSQMSVLCIPNELAARWIENQAKTWRRRLLSEPGFESPRHLKVCQAPPNSGDANGRSVFAQLSEERIFVPRIRDRGDEISVAHEYLHIAFRNHPRGRDEVFIENLARALLEAK